MNPKYRPETATQAISHIVESAGQVTAAFGKLHRFGPHSVNPELSAAEQVENGRCLLDEIRDLHLACRHFNHLALLAGADAAMRTLVPGDRIRAHRCGGIEATYTFAAWEGAWVVSESGISDISPTAITKVNGRPVDFVKIALFGVGS